MKKWLRILALLLTVGLLTVTAGLAQPLYTDAGLTWGMSREETVRKVQGFGKTDEVGTPAAGRVLVVRNLAFCGFSMDAWCAFENGVLESVTYLLPEGFALDGDKLTQSLGLFGQRLSNLHGQGAPNGENALVWQTGAYRIEAGIGDYSYLNGIPGAQIGVRYTRPAAQAAPAAGVPQPAASQAPGAQPAGTPVPAADGSVLMTVQASERMDYDHTNGQSWNRSFAVNGVKFYGETTLRVRAGDELTLSATVTDSDSRPDTETESITHTVTEADLTEGFTEVFRVRVTENEGVLSGKEARFAVTFRFVTPQGKAAPYVEKTAVPAQAPSAAPEKPAVKEDGSVLMTVRAAEMMMYDHTGGERWNRSFMVDSEKFYGETQVYVRPGQTLTLAATVTDSDARPDSASGSVEHTVTEQDLTEGFTEEFKILVTENEGPRAGREARFRITFTFER